MRRMDLVDVLERINRSSLRFLQSLTPEATYQAIIEEALKLVNGDEGYIALAEGEELVIKYAYPPSLDSLIMRKRGFTYTAYQQKKAYVTYAEEFGHIHPELVKAGIQSTIFIPIVNKGKSMGAMNIMSYQRLKKFSQKELSILKLFGSMASMAIQKTQLYAETKEALEARNLFISTAAHEIRTPVTTIFGYAQLFLNNFTAGRTLKQEWLDSLHGECNRLRHLINDLLEASHIHSGNIRYNFKEYSLKEIVKRAINNFKFNHPDRSLIIRDLLQEKQDLVIGDSDRLIQAFINLLDNAAKFSPPESKIALFLKKEDANLVVRIKDKGKGITKTDLEKVFDRYYRGGGAKYEGLGLGLFLVKNIIEHHHGSIELKSKLNKGTTAEIRLPKRV